MKNYQKVDMHISSICKTAYIVLLFVVFNDPFPTFMHLFFPSIQSSAVLIQHILHICRNILANVKYMEFILVLHTSKTTDTKLPTVNDDSLVGHWCDQPNVVLCKVYIWSRILYTAVRLWGWYPVMLKCDLLRYNGSQWHFSWSRDVTL